MKSCRSYRVTLLAMCVAAAMLLSFVESRIPTFIPVPGVLSGSRISRCSSPSAGSGCRPPRR